MNRDISVASKTTSNMLFEWVLSLAACTILFGPILAVSFYYSNPLRFELGTAAETVGIGVIMRAMLRRLFRSGARGAMQSAVGTVARASSRTMTRRIVRVGVKSMTSLFSRTYRRSAEVTDAPMAEGGEEDADEPYQSTPRALGLGFLALSLSLAGVLLILDVGQPSSSGEAPQLVTVLGGMPFAVAVLLGATPILVYAGLLSMAASGSEVKVHFRTGWEALLLQAYFTCSGSFLPLSTDAEIAGQPTARARLALVSLLGLLVLHFVFWGLAQYLDSYPLHFVAGMFLLYCFVFSFPIAPLDGYYLWVYSRWLWFAVSIPVLALFIVLMPESLYAIL